MRLQTMFSEVQQLLCVEITCWLVLMVIEWIPGVSCSLRIAFAVSSLMCTNFPKTFTAVVLYVILTFLLTAVILSFAMLSSFIHC